MIDPRKLKGAAALIEIAERLKTFGAEVEKALESGEGRERNFDLETPMGKMSGRFGVRMGPAARPAAPGASAARKPARPAPRTPDPLIDVHFDGVHLIVTTETDDALAEVAVAGDQLTIRARAAAERVIKLPCRVKEDSLSYGVVNGILEATMTPQDVVG